MKLTKTADGFKLAMSRQDWLSIGERHGWLNHGPEGELQLAPDYQYNTDDVDYSADMGSPGSEGDLPPLRDETDSDGATHPMPRPDSDFAAPKGKPSLWHRALDGVTKGMDHVQDFLGGTGDA